MADTVARLLATMALICHVSAGSVKWIPSYAGPFVMYSEKMYTCPSVRDNMFDCHIRPSQFRSPALIQSTLQTLEGNFTWRAPIDDSWSGMVKMDVWSGNQWKENSLLFPIAKAYCSAVRTNFPGLYETFYKMDAWSKDPCVFPVGSFQLNNRAINWTTPNFPVLPYGRYRTTNTVWSPKKEKTACFIFDLQIVAKL